MPSRITKNLQEKKFKEHKKRMQECKSSIDNKTPREMPLSMRNLIERRRVQALIDQDNRILLDRLALAMSVKNIDNEPKKVKFMSLGENARKKELTKIMLDNKRLLERIQTTVPAYNHVQWERDAEQRCEYLRNMTEFPDYFVPPGSSAKPKRPTTGTSQSRGDSASNLMSPQPPMSLMDPRSSLGSSESYGDNRIRLRPLTKNNVTSY